MNIKGHDIAVKTYTTSRLMAPMAPPFKPDTGFSQVSLFSKSVGPTFGGTIDGVIQSPGKRDSVQLDVYQGFIVMANTELAGGDTVTFSLDNSLIDIGDNIIVSMISATTGTYIVTVDDIGRGGCTISLFNHTITNVTEAPLLIFTVIKGIIPPNFFG